MGIEAVRGIDSRAIFRGSGLRTQIVNFRAGSRGEVVQERGVNV
jgi:hypothetical protein